MYLYLHGGKYLYIVHSLLPGSAGISLKLLIKVTWMTTMLDLIRSSATYVSENLHCLAEVEHEHGTTTSRREIVRSGLSSLSFQYWKSRRSTTLLPDRSVVTQRLLCVVVRGKRHATRHIRYTKHSSAARFHLLFTDFQLPLDHPIRHWKTQCFCLDQQYMRDHAYEVHWCHKDNVKQYNETDSVANYLTFNAVQRHYTCR